MDITETQLTDVQRRQPQAHFEMAPDGQRLLVLPDVPVPPGWNMNGTTIRVLVPAGFPHVKPDCFFVDANLRLAGGNEPTNSALQAVFGGQYRWFSWHLGSWEPTSGTLDQYLHFCQQRLRQVR